MAAIAVVGAGFGEFYAQHAGPAPLAAFDPGMVLPWILLAALIAAAAFGPTGRRVAAHLAWVGAAAGILSVLVSPWAVHFIGPHLGRDISRVSRVGPPPALDAYRLPAWFLLAPAAGLVMGGLSLRRRWHLIRRLWDRTGP